MKKLAISMAAVASILIFAGCDTPPGTAEKIAGIAPKPASSASLGENKPSPENSVAIINGKPLSKSQFQAVLAEVAQRAGGQKVPEDKVLDGLIARELLNQEAEKQKLDTDPAVAERLENSRRDVMVAALIEQFRKTANVAEDEIKKEYDARLASMPSGKTTEYKARHILLESEQAAKDVLAKLQKGAKFDDLAKKLSKDPSAKQNGGELDWFNPKQMVSEFSAAIATLKNGETTKEPVKSQFGWHVIQREDSREQDATPPPPYDAVKEQFRNMLIGQKLQKHIEELKATAKIERLAPPAPANSESDPAPKEGNAAPVAKDAKPPVTPVEAGKPVPPEAAPTPKPAK